MFRPYDLDPMLYELRPDSNVARRTREIPQEPSWTARLILNVGAWLVKAGCRLERLGFGRLGSQPAGSSMAVDCGCAS